ncbi:MAG TPA: acyl-CoA carboxylase epsilon subunit [Streptosporangiaceae bacterium]|nr:acyl-CoA carboxylase epsilon subunit [Streptosporangiaceae bacterium]
MTTSQPAGHPLLEVVAGHPTAEEMAALTAVVSAAAAARQRDARSAATRQAAAQAPGGWTDRAALLRAPLTPGPGAWRRSGRPR